MEYFKTSGIFTSRAQNLKVTSCTCYHQLSKLSVFKKSV